MTEQLPRLRSAIIGCGAISKSHLDYLTQSNHTQLVGVCDRSKALSEAASLRYGEVNTFTSHKEMLRTVQPNVVHVLTPPSSHESLVRDLLSAGIHVICEKPMCHSSYKTIELLELAKKSDLTLIESCNLKFFEPVMALKEKVLSGALGEVREYDILLQVDFLAGPFGDCNLSGPAVDLPAGAVHDFLPHLAYLFLYLAEVKEVDVVNGRLVNLSGNTRAVFDYLDVLVIAGKARGRLRICADAGPPAFKIVVRGALASIETDLYNPFLSYSGPPDVGKRAPFGQIREGLRQMIAGCRNLRNKIGQHGADYGMGSMLDASYRALRNGDIAPVQPEDIIATARFCDSLAALRLS
jgi:predicted dehydrogenase